MSTKTKIALAAAFVAASASFAFAQGFDPNPANRYPSYASPNGAAPYIGTMPQGVASQRVAPQALQSAPVRLYQGRNAAPAEQFGGYGAQQDEIAVDLRDRASSPYAGVVN